MTTTRRMRSLLCFPLAPRLDQFWKELPHPEIKKYDPQLDVPKVRREGTEDVAGQREGRVARVRLQGRKERR